MRDNRIRHLWLFLLASDFFAVVAAYYATLFVRFHSEWGERFFTVLNRSLGVRETGDVGEVLELFYYARAPRIILFLSLTLFVIYALRNLYSGRRFIRPQPLAWNVVLSNAAALALFYAYFYLRRNVFHPRSFFATLLFLNCFFCVGFRVWMDSLLSWARERFGIDRWRTVVAGRGREADFICGLIETIHPHGLEVVQRLHRQKGETTESFLASMEVAPKEQQADMLICAEQDLNVAHVILVLELAQKLGIPVKILTNELEVVVDQGGMRADRIHGVPLVHFDVPPRDWQVRRISRILTLLFGVLTLVALAPLLALIALVVRLTSKGPVFFVQERIGVNREPFMMYKFRTMRHRADELQAQVEEFNESGEGLFKIKRDPRVTPVGRFLRRFSMDELPQLVNVLLGRMVFVGPRPLPRRDFENYYEEWHYSRHGGMPGLTCLWQVSGRSDLDFHNMCILDVYYLRNQSWVLDVKILLRTVWVVLFGKGAY
ncbi:MAG: exopolysaccharide biosynthesis polyprenyl glycosylphosphotransferase [Kiritimatiellia bacterium]|jgi:exopolysaccharide biosynthesis polyprenyl glycosylphosphotransferase|nr:exopolysaccharide biosynthesis polyprenyl glycosylphosphotransferase [Kiritimatiellia bacterium]MDP6811175.1 exopolysaccharide biosynthesis polyprenyl glycosylphosphotransferase [Kiritimatiellia bacterium]MDP7025268.1 exopolysaccharide biosynthesis polyprenyl glycosylphosphotransferase [Kiritimatiellia bacterium]